MTTSLLTAIATPPSGRASALLLDHHEYAQSVFLRNRPAPWEDPTSYARFFNQAQGLLKPDLAILDLNHFYTHHLEQNTTLRNALSQKTRTGYALRTMLADKDLTRNAIDLAQTLTAMASGPVVLQIPSPMQWLRATHHHSGSSDTDSLDADDAENSSMYVADWLRGFAALPFAAILLDDRPITPSAPATPVGFDAYAPIVNVTAHYRLVIGMRDDHGVTLHQQTIRGSILHENYWLGEQTTLPPGDFHITQIPATAIPEIVLNQLAQLK
ncbi:hypothetical protein [Rhodococcus qingshengii]|uniref:hypothetical protein n=1 Tax=Rhodococcus qingshengii TaxID=334542 RepID=UPI00210EE0AB|nr:hypothetical protein [Rhodococcus qingshengii]MCQ4152000.1 hypothetical protein [Rhodococcus qingshengii]MCZ4618664.1 hypothetical protein [Rhodococcus qingshengii]